MTGRRPGESPGPDEDLVHAGDFIGDEHLVHGDDLHELEELATEEGLHALDVPEKLIEDELRRKSPTRRAVEIGTSLGVVVLLFAFIIPRVLGADYREVWNEVKTLEGPVIVGLFALWMVNLATVFAFLTRALPGLRYTQAGVMNLSGSAVADVVPFGGAVGIGATYAQCLSWGFTHPAITLSILVSGVWNTFAKMAFPLVAIIALGVVGRTAPGLNAAAFLGFGAFLAGVGLFAMVIRSERLATRIGERLDGALNRLRRLLRRPPHTGVVEAVLDFRHRSVTLVGRRWKGLTWWIVAYKVTSFLLELACVRAVGIGADQVGVVEVLAAYTLGELLSANPLTPSGVGFVEAGNAGLLIYFGAPHDAAVAAVLLFRFFDYFIEIPAGGAAWLVWATKRSWRRLPGEPAVVPVPEPTG